MSRRGNTQPATTAEPGLADHGRVKCLRGRCRASHVAQIAYALPLLAAALLWRSSERLDVLGEDAEPLALPPALLFESV